MTLPSGRGSRGAKTDQGVSFDHGIFGLLLLYQMGLIDDLDGELFRRTRRGGGRGRRGGFDGLNNLKNQRNTGNRQAGVQCCSFPCLALLPGHSLSSSPSSSRLHHSYCLPDSASCPFPGSCPERSHPHSTSYLFSLSMGRDCLELWDCSDRPEIPQLTRSRISQDYHRRLGSVELEGS